jgi:arginine decarboxylase
MIDEVINQIKLLPAMKPVDVPHIFTEFGSFTVGENECYISNFYTKQQNDRKNGYDSSFYYYFTPDAWAINKRFIMLAVNRWR